MAGGAGLIVLDARTIFEPGAERLCRRVVSVLADRAVRRARILRRDGISEAEAEHRMQAQQADGFYAARSDYVLDNTASVSDADIDDMLAALGCGRQGDGF